MIYLDNSATTRPFDGVIDAMDRCMREQYFNASAAYKPAVDVDRAMRECRKTIAAQLGIQESGVIFTGGGTESDNLAILGTAAALRQRANFVCSAIEHPAVAETIRRVEQMGHTVRVLPIDARGVVDLAACEAVDQGLGQALAALNEVGGAMIVTADHGNCETMVDPETGGPHTAHTTNPVPVILVGGPAGVHLREGGRLADLAPTLLELMGLPQPAEMTGRSLIVR